MIEWSGQNWYTKPSYSPPTISIIEPPAPVEGMVQEKDPNAVPFGFARVLQEKPKRKPKPRAKRKARPKE